MDLSFLIEKRVREKLKKIKSSNFVLERDYKLKDKRTNDHSVS